MKFLKSSVIILFLLIITMGVVCAEDANQTSQDTLEIADTDDIVSVDPEVKTFDDLNASINQHSGSIELESDYTYNITKDKVKTITFNNANYEIDGKGHSIDGNNKTFCFEIRNNSNVILKNLIIKNCNDSSIRMYGSHLITVNVTFLNNHAPDLGGAVFFGNGTYSTTNDTFIDNTAPQGGSLFGLSSKLYLTNASFTNKDSLAWSLICGDDCLIDITETVFRGISSKYATAIFNNNRTVIRNSKFINLHANQTAGAIAIKGHAITKEVLLTIENCEFINVTANKNGGAIFADINGNNDNVTQGKVLITFTNFTNCSGNFGGAYLQLGGICEIANTTFLDNSVTDYGGAIYTSNASVTIRDSVFKNNKADTELGGALYIDFGDVTTDNVTFENNMAKHGGAIYSYNNYYKIMNSRFVNNGEDIHTCFDDNGSNIINCGNIKSDINNNTFTIDVRYNKNPITINRQKINGSASDKYFDLRNQSLVTPVKNQGNMGACWAFGTAGAFESAYLIATGQTIDISENNIQNLGLRYSIYGNKLFVESGTYYSSVSYLVSWLGAINETEETYDELGKISSLKDSSNGYLVVNAIFIDITDRNAIKEALTKYGALDIYVYGANLDSEYYNGTTHSIYNPTNKGNHYVTLVGWNDTYSKNNFNIHPTEDGAWICKNSWGTEWGEEGYFYLSYCDASLKDSEAIGFSFEDGDYYERLYQNEMVGISFYDSTHTTYGHIFTSQEGDLIAAVGTYFEKANTQYTISVYLNNYLAYTQSGKSTHAGYNTIRLNKYLSVDKNSTFEIRIQSSSMPIVQDTRFPIVSGVDYYIDINGNSKDPADENTILPVKAYTFKNPGITENILKCYSDMPTIFTVKNVEGDKLIINFKGQNLTINITDGKGNISLGVLPVGEYLVEVYYKNQTFESQISIQTSIDTDDTYSATIAYNTALSFTAKFLDVDGKPLINTKVTAKFDGETIEGAITNGTGFLTIDIFKGNSIGTHYIEFANPQTGETIKVAIKIVSRFSGNTNINMYYFDGTTYKVRIVGDDGQFVGAGEIVTIKISKKTYKVKTDANGYINFKIPKAITPGKYTISATYAGQTVKNTLKVKQVLKTSKTVKVKRSAKKLVLKATLKNGKKALKKKTIKFKVNGKTYKAKTNKKGIAKVTIKKSAIKKFKKKKYTIKVSYLNDVVKSTLKVKR